MELILEFLQDNSQVIGMAMALVVLVVLVILIHKINVMKARMEEIVGRVENYLNVIMDQEPDSVENASQAGEAVTNARKMNEEEQTKLISSVLQEIFP